MTSPETDIDPLIDALRSDLPERKDAERVRARLIGAGIILAGAVVAPSTAAGAAALGTAGSGAGLLSKAAGMFGVSKIGLVAIAVGAAAAVPAATYVALDSIAKDSRGAQSQPQSTVALGSAVRPGNDRAPTQLGAPDDGVANAEPPAPAELERPAAAAVASIRSEPSRAAKEQREQPAESEPPARAPGSVAAFPALESQSQESTLRAETELVDKALSALRSRDTAAARAYLLQHAQRFPNGALVRERERALQRVKRAEMGQTGQTE